MLELALPLFVTAAVGALTVPVMQALKIGSAKVNALPGWLTVLITGVLALGMTWVAKQVGVPLPTDVFGMDGTAVSGVLAAVFSFLGHKIIKTKEAMNVAAAAAPAAK